ncbi:hypothetical protein DPMN_126570 [Dreissena polymorpha]|uniref:Uncharacterized protein n=1 Tax=Dreissena polymorpha TaxID=45954 RepID=A0A9D4H3K7_DREPO|nr:hypothetical protein DPMN_126570 [Dreissena polymorpha]
MARITNLEDRLRVLEVQPLLDDVNNHDLNAEYTGNCVIDSSVTFTAVPICVSVIGSPDNSGDVCSVPVVIDNQCDKPLVTDITLDVVKPSNRACSCRVHTTTEDTSQVTSMQLPTPVRVTERSDDIPTGEWQEGGDFEAKRRRRTRRFCLLGLSENVNTDILLKVIERKGPTV